MPRAPTPGGEIAVSIASSTMFAICCAPSALAMAVAAPVVDMRSDTVTTPTPSMSKAMAMAEVGDAVFGDDPTEAKLEAKVAEMFGKEAALFVPTGTQGNLISLMAHCWERGSEFVVGNRAHIYLYEQGGAAQLGGVHPRALATADDGTFSLEDLRGAIRPDDHHFPVTRCVTLENTHNMCGGVVLPTDYVASVGKIAREEAGATLHLDGARIWHAAAALGESLEQVAAPADSLSVCLSKGLGAPAGSLVVGSADLIAKGKRLRKALGGTMRQTGVLCAAGLVGLEEILPGLPNDHANAQTLAAGLAAAGFDVEPVATNLVFFSADEQKLGVGAPAIVAAAAAKGIRFLCIGGQRMRCVTHHQVSAEGVERALDVIGRVVAEPERYGGRVAAAPAASYAGGKD